MPSNKNRARELDTSLIPDVLQAAEQLLMDVRTFAAAAQRDALPVWLPPAYAGSPAEQRELAIHSLCRLWIDELGEFPASGLLCAGDETMAAAEALNATKQRLRAAVVALRASVRHHKTRITRLIDQVAAGDNTREAELARALRNMGFARLDLVACYRQITVLPSDLRSISWTWAKQHREITRVSYTEALAMADGFDSENSRRTALDALAHEDPDRPLAYVKIGGNQLRANIQFGPRDAMQRKMVVTSGVCLTGQDLPPAARIKWRECPEDPVSDRLTRSDARIEQDPICPELSLHRYANSP